MEQETTLIERYLPEEIIKEILLRLDVKSLRRYECVSKSWQTLIRQPSFINNHFKRQPSSVIFFHSPPKNYGSDCDYSVSHYSEDGRDIEMCQEFPDRPLEPMGCDKGVFCLVDDENNDVWLWNPATTEFKMLPSPPTFRGQNHIYLHGLGYDSTTDDFKVVRVCAKRGESFKLSKSDNVCSVYNLRSNSWKIMQMLDNHSPSSSLFSGLSSGIRNIFGCQSRSVVVNGSIHWTKLGIEIDDNNQDSNLIVAFDLSTEVFKVINLPKLGDINEYVQLMGKWSERLSLVVKKGMPKSIFEIWVMKEYGVSDSWMKQVKVDFDTYPLELQISGRRTDYYFYRPLAFGNNGKILLMEPLDHRLVWYDLESGKVTFMCTSFSIDFAFSTAENIIHI